MESLCQVQGKPELYGLGIRVAFYLQWFGAILAEYLEMADLAAVQLLGLLLSAATFVGLVVQLSMTTLQPADIYIVLLLAAGIFLPLVPLYVWKAVTCFNRHWDPFRWPKDTTSPAIKGLSFLLLLAITSLSIWFWTTYVPGEDCSSYQYGFLFSAVALGNTAYVASNAILWILILVVCAGILMVKAGFSFAFWADKRRRKKARRIHIQVVQDLTTFAKAIVAAVVTAAVELSVVWNNIDGVNGVADVAQMIPLFVSGGIVVRAVLMHFVNRDGDSDSDSAASSDSRPPMASVRVSGGIPPPPPPAAHMK
ncbi:hypothetical protein F5X68DRAFT_279331 [Plectosphaerella plurivora]|uniref:Uncharacterized protein n=1 Tax=Plectosphaerella plurivora TaxID=936078 RepID=A0A9P8V2J5_9PEZI|nr:hypothetical protein F5X68DRAFT_279331 [Plectosphaerella plurivora]